MQAILSYIDPDEIFAVQLHPSARNSGGIAATTGSISVYQMPISHPMYRSLDGTSDFQGKNQFEIAIDRTMRSVTTWHGLHRLPIRSQL
jgi:hypothetical protein